MKVLVVGRFYEQSFGQHIADSLRFMGHEAVELETGPRITSVSSRIRKRLTQVQAVLHEAWSTLPLAQRMSLARLEAAATDVDLTIVCHDLLFPSQVDAIRKRSRSPVVLWFPDAIANIGRALFLNAPYDAIFLKDPYIVEMLRREVDRRVYYLPEACNPRLHRPPTTAIHPRFHCDIAIAGNIYTNRVAVLEQLDGYDVKMWGNPPPLWMNVSRVRPWLQSRFVVGEELAQAYRGASIVLNNLHPGEIWGVNVRTFEAAAIGAFQLVSWRPALGALFNENEIVAYVDRVDLRKKIDLYLGQPELRSQVAEAGQRRALQNHTYDQRLALLVATVEGSSDGFPYTVPGETRAN